MFRNVVLAFVLTVTGCASESVRTEGEGTASRVHSADELEPARIESARRFLELLREKQGMTGLSVAVAIDGNILWTEGFGFADAENGIAAGPETVYRIGSVSKLITIAALARLNEGRYDDVVDALELFANDPLLYTPGERWSYSSYG